MSWRLALKAAPWIVIAALVGLALWQRNTITDRSAKLEASVQREQQLTKANRSAQDTIARLANARVDNDAIADAVAARMAGVATRETHTNTIIKEAVRNDPTVADWSARPVPDSVREALTAR